MVAYRGTAEGGGVKTDLVQGLGLRSDQYDRAIRLAQKAQRAYGTSVLTTGHSLGGGLAVAGSAVSGLHGAVFNPAGVSAATVGEYGAEPSDAEDLITSYHVPGEILSSAQSPLGRAVLSPLANVIKGGMAVFNAAKERRLPTWREVTPTAVPGPVGTRVQLPSVRAAELPLVTAGVRHTGIFPIQGMEQQKEADRATIERHADE